MEKLVVGKLVVENDWSWIFWSWKTRRGKRRRGKDPVSLLTLHYELIRVSCGSDLLKR